MKTLPISAAGQMDISPDGSTIVVSSDIIPSLTFIDTASQSIISVSAMPAQASVFGQTMQGFHLKSAFQSLAAFTEIEQLASFADFTKRNDADKTESCGIESSQWTTCGSGRDCEIQMGCWCREGIRSQLNRAACGWVAA